MSRFRRGICCSKAGRRRTRGVELNTQVSGVRRSRSRHLRIFGAHLAISQMMSVIAQVPSSRLLFFSWRLMHSFAIAIAI